MKLSEAKAECERWFKYLDKQRQKSIDMQKIASDVRNNIITSDEARRKVKILDSGGITVYDGANLEQAVKTLLKHLDKHEKKSTS